MTTLSRTFDSIAARDSEARWERWEAKGAAEDAKFRRTAARLLWILAGVALMAAALFL
jgi:hypothetical protein